MAITREGSKPRWWQAIGMGDALVLIGMALIAIGCWDAYRPASFIVPGLVLIFYALPTRPPFIERESKARRS